MSTRPATRTATRVATVLGSALLIAPLVTSPASAATPDHLVISEVYGGGGNSTATYTHDFVELYNPTERPVPLAGYTVQYYSSAGNTGPASNTCTLPNVTLESGKHFLIQQAKGSNGMTGLPGVDLECAAAMSASAGSIELSDSDGIVDLVGYGSTAKYETSPAPRLDNTSSAQRKKDTTGHVDTDDNSADFLKGSPDPQGSGSTGDDTQPAPGPGTTSIATIQGTGAASSITGQTVTTTGVVTAAYPTGGFRGVYLQTPGTGGTTKSAGDASDGIFLFSDWASQNLAVGDCVVVKDSEVKEFSGLTELVGGFVTQVEGCDPVTATPLASLPATDADKEPYEGMLVQPQDTYTITNNYQLNQYGQLGLTPGEEPLYTATEVVTPDRAAAYEAENATRSITLDDGSSWDYLKNGQAKGSALPYLAQDEPMRTGSQVTFARPVILDHRFQWNFQPTGQVVGSTDPDDPLATENDREATPPAVGGDVRVATFNVLNYFTDLGRDEENCRYYADREGNPVATNSCAVRGAWSDQAFRDQQEKIVTAINGLGADIVSLEEIETSSALSHLPGQDRDRALSALVDALNAAGGTWAYAPSPRVVAPNEDVIRTAFIYNPDRVQLLGPSETLIDPAFANARQPLAQKFKLRTAGSPFVVVANHFKSKGSGADDGTGQGLSNPSREAQARALTDWVDDAFGGKAVLLVGDFNAYSKETPVQIIEAAGYTNLAKAYEPGSATYQFGGRLGSLDHVFANEKAEQMVSGAGVWDINGDESIAMQYSRRNYNVTDFHTAEAYASSDHDPIVVGLEVKGGKNTTGGRPKA